MKTARLHSCNILSVDNDASRLWRFGFDKDGKPVESGEHMGGPADSLPASWVAKGLGSLWQRRVNLSWFPAENVFLRVVQLPLCDPSELPAMVELQLEKLSPLPVTQIVWTIEVLSGASQGMQTVVVLIAARNLIEDFLGKLEGRGYAADRLELPLLHQLMALDTGGEGLWVIADQASSGNLCLVAWWAGGVLQNLTLLRGGGGERWGRLLQEELTQMAWAGEMEGWLTAATPCHLVADADLAARWQPILAEWSGRPIEIVPVKSPPELAALNAARLAANESKANLVPPEYALRFRQQFIDRIWMGALGTVMGIYLVGVLIFLAIVQVFNLQKGSVEKQIRLLTPAFTNAMQMEARLQVLKEQEALKVAALECWRAACIELPAELTLTDLSLQQGKVLTIHGSAKAGDESMILQYNERLSKYVVNNSSSSGTNQGTSLLFSKVQPYTSRGGAGGAQQNINWDFACQLNRPDLE